MSRLHGKVAAITGGSRGIGLAAAKRFVQEGAQVAVLGRDPRLLGAAARDLGSALLTVEGDACNPDDLAGLFAQTVARFGRLDILFANAGMSTYAAIEDIDAAFLDALVAVNIKGVFFAVQKALPHLSPGASIVVTTSILNSKGIPGGSIYAATKAASRSLVRSFAAELGPRRIRVNAVSPGPTDTSAFAPPGATSTSTAETKARAAARVPMGRLATPEEIANVALFLASDESSYMQGAEIVVDGGASQL